MSFRYPFRVLLLGGLIVAIDLASGKEVSSFEVTLVVGLFVVACLFGVVEKQFEIRMRRKAERLYRAEEGSDEKLPSLPPAGRLRLTPIIYGIFVFGSIASILWSLLRPDLLVGGLIALATAGAIAFMVTIRALNGHFSVQPADNVLKNGDRHLPTSKNHEESPRTPEPAPVFQQPAEEPADRPDAPADSDQ